MSGYQHAGFAYQDTGFAYQPGVLVPTGTVYQDADFAYQGTDQFVYQTVAPSVVPPPGETLPPPPTWGSGAGGSSVYRKPTSSNDLVRQLMELKRIRERQVAEQPKIILPERVGTPAQQRQLLMLLPYFMEIIDEWEA